MGGAVSSGRDNSELVDNLKNGNYIRSPQVEAAFRAVDRADYMPPDSRNLAYKDLAWKNGQLHLSAPCIYSEVMEGLELGEGLAFLNVGSGTGYLSTMVGLLLGARGVNHGIEIQPYVLTYANKRLSEFLNDSPAVDEFDFCIPTFVQGNGLCLPPGSMRYDRVYCGASCPEEYHTYFKHLINVGGLLVMPLNDNLLQVRRKSETEWTTRSLLSVSFASLLTPSHPNSEHSVKPPELSVSPASLQVMVRSVIRGSVQRSVLSRNPELREPPLRPTVVKKRCSRRICIPIDADSDMEMDGLHDLEDRASGAAEMNALLSLVLSMGQSRAAGALRFDSDPESSSSSSSSGSSSSGSSIDSVYSKTTVEYQAENSDEGADADKGTSDVAAGGGGASEGRREEASDMQTIPLDGAAPSAAAEERSKESEQVAETKAGSSNTFECSTDSGDELWHEVDRAKRHKLDSGIGEEHSPEAAAAPAGGSPNHLDHVEQISQAERVIRRLHKRGRPPPSDSSDSSDSSSASSSPRRHKKKRPAPDAHRARRQYISLHMQRAIALLPLPPPLRHYVNLDRPVPPAC